MNTETKLRVTEIQRFCMHDGPGIRTTVFLKGCPLRCKWCHNPETQKCDAEILFYSNKCIGCGCCVHGCAHNAHVIEEFHMFDRSKCILCGKCADVCPANAIDICGSEMTIENILTVIEKDRAFYGNIGGVTLSGGEPFAQKEKTIALLKACKRYGFSTVVETCGYADPDIIRNAAPYVDLFLWDVKDTDDARHKKYTGVSNRIILENLLLVNATHAKIRLRCILVGGVNTNELHYSAIIEIAKKINNFDGVEILPYHAYGGTKTVFLGGADNGRKEWIPTSKEIERAKDLLKMNNILVY